MNTGAIVRKNPALLIPSAYITKLTDKYKTGFGFAMIDNNSIQMMGVKASELKSPMTLATAFEETQKAFKDSTILFHCLSADAPLPADEMQPFTLVIKDKQPVVVAALEGGFITFDRPGTNHTNEYHAVNSFLKEEIQATFTEAEGATLNDKLDKMLEMLDNPRFRRSLQNILVPRGVITIMTQNDKILSFAKNETGQSYDWGEVSDKMDYVEETAPAAAAGPTFAEKLAAMAKGTPVDEPSTIPKPASVPAIPPKPDVEPHNIPKTATSVGALNSHRIFPPPKLTGKAFKKWRKRHFGKLCQITEEEAFSKGIASNQLLPSSQLRSVIANSEKVIAANEIDLEEEEDEEEVVQPAPLEGAPPILLPTAMDNIHKNFDNKFGLDAAQLQALETKFNTYSKQMGYNGFTDPNHPIWYSRKGLTKLIREQPHEAMVAMLEAFTHIRNTAPGVTKVQPEPAVAPAAGGSFMDKLKALGK